MSILNKDNLTSAITCKCPNCNKGKMFKYPILKISKLTSMYEKCPHCGFNFFPELGFYYGAMYVSYAINVALIAIFGVSIEILFSPENILALIGAIILPVMLFVPLTFRLSRSLFLHFFGKIK